MAEAQLANRIRDICWRHKRRYGSPRIAAQLRREGRRVSQRQVAELMAVVGLQVMGRGKFKHTTHSAHRRPVSPHLVGRQPVVAAPNQIWVGDITYIPTGNGWLLPVERR
ncbi:MAG TPA: IS3 family transposase [bacterium]|nr:IS3 family transposase [bacterium]